jgi:hypothetical protein
MASKASVLLFGVDTLIINVKVPHSPPKSQEASQEDVSEVCLTEELEAVLNAWMEAAKNQEKPYKTAWKHEDITLMMHPRGTQTHRYLLKNGLIDLMIGPFLNNSGLARVKFSSEYLWKNGAACALVNTHKFLWELFQGDFILQCSEIHVCADVADFSIPRNYEQLFVSRASTYRPIKTSALDRPVYRYHRLETLQFSGHGNPISAAIYDKPAEIEQKSQEKRWFYDLWKRQGWDGEAPVWRIECRIKRAALHEMDIEDTYDALDKVPVLWSFCVGHAGQKDGWVRMVQMNTRDSNRRRWKTAGSWEVVQNAFEKMLERIDGLADIQRERKRQINLDRAEKAIAGYTTTYGAWLQDEVQPDDDVSIVLQRLYDKMLRIWEDKGEDFHSMRIKKQFDYHIS